jgi:hypothetical protein
MGPGEGRGSESRELEKSTMPCTTPSCCRLLAYIGPRIGEEFEFEVVIEIYTGCV